MSAVPAASAPALSATRHEGPLDLRRLIEWLAADGVISPVEAKRTIARCAQAESRQAPLVRLANVAMTRESDNKPLDLEMLTQWLAGRAGLTYLRIDPLKVDVGQVADVMSVAYAERRKVLPLQVRPTEVVIATCEPLSSPPGSPRSRRHRAARCAAWWPTRSTSQRYTTEFFALAKSVRAAQKTGEQHRRARTSSSWSSSARATSSSTPTTSTSSTSSTGCGSTPSTSAPRDIHLEPRREQGVIRFRIDGVLHQVYQMPPGVMNAMIARIKLLGRMDVVEKRRPQDGRIKTRNPAATRSSCACRRCRPRSARRW